MIRKENSPNSGVFVARTSADLASLSGQVPVVHLTEQGLITAARVGELLGHCQPGVIQVSPSRVQLVGPGIRTVLENHGVALQVGRAKDKPYYDQVIPPDYAVKKALYENMFLDPMRADQFGKMLKNDFLEARVGQVYFEDAFVPVREIARQLELKPRLVQERLACFCAWLGWPYQDKNIIEARRGLENRLATLERRSARQEAREKLARTFAVGDELPPKELPSGRWKTWQVVHRAVKNYPDALIALRQNHPRSADILTDYVRLDRWDGQTHRVNEIGDKFRITKQTVLNQVARAVKFLGQY